MTLAGRLARGEINFKAKILLNNSETLEYIASVKPKVEVKKEVTKPKKEVKEVKEKDVK